MKTTLLLISLTLNFSIYAQNEFDRDIMEGKIEAQIQIQKEEKLRTDFQKLQKDNDKAIKLLNKVGAQSAERFSNPEDKAQVELDFSGFLGRYQIVKQSINDLERAFPHLDQSELEQSSKNLNQLIKDLQNYLN